MPNTKTPQQNKQINKPPKKANNHTISLNSSPETEKIHHDFAVLYKTMKSLSFT